ncbi:MAG TPA: bifunctional phosphopantothenoylcysteine decarboxylase/phosphopantothenate--cysteine ligase CoaBC [Blastocatellia bacterium]|nr:bifunctional phosphopantothenoylcysteine decarboxylase/phosphopantothenate--cysteine ligase CoaBC [Blastocatellia bacterium]
MKIILGVTGCIAAYKAAEVLRQLQQRGAEVRVIMTRHACEFVRPLTFEALSRSPVVTDMFAPGLNLPVKHIELARWADLLLVAPATANTLAKFAHGLADDFLSTVYLAFQHPVVVAPAMDQEMWLHPITQENIERLRHRGVVIIEPESGYLASGIVGEGRLADPVVIADRVMDVLSSRQRERDFVGQRVLVTAGPTCEDIDPVRFISNRSSGKMGYALAEAALRRGAQVTLITGPTSLVPPPGAEVVRVRRAQEMYEAVLRHVEAATIVIKAAAVADYRPASTQPTKLKKGTARLLLELEPTTDILAELGKRKGSRILVGFAAETENLIENGREKLQRKNLDLIVVNDVSREDAGFGSDFNAALLIDRSGSVVELPLMSKREMAERILDHVKRLWT